MSIEFARALRRIATAIPFLSLLALGYAFPARASWESGVLVSTGTGTAHDRVRILRPTVNDLVVTWWTRYGTTQATWAQRMTSEGTTAPGWPAGAVYLAPNLSVNPFASTMDGTGGVFNTYWSSNNVYFKNVRGDASLGGDWPVAATAASEVDPGIAGDGVGGAYVGWVEQSSPRKLYLKRFESDGSLAAGWPVAGLLVSPSLPGYRMSPAIDGDGAGGAYVLWHGTDRARVLRISSNGLIVAGWPAGGLALGYASASVFIAPQILPSGEGRIAVWYDVPSDRRMTVQRFLPNGTLDPAWPVDGVAILIPNANDRVLYVSDGLAGVTLLWEQDGLPRTLHLLSSGAIAPGYAPAGNSPLDAGAQYVPAPGVFPGDGLVAATGRDGGLIFAWKDARASRPGVRVRWLMADGTPDPVEPDTGRVATPPGADPAPRAAIDDGSGGIFVAWQEWPYLEMSHLASSAVVGVEPPRPASRGLDLRAPAPNPASRELSVRVALPTDAPAQLELLDLAGRRVRAQELAGGGERTVRLDGVDRLAAGIYLLRLTQGRATRFARVAIVR